MTFGSGIKKPAVTRGILNMSNGYNWDDVDAIIEDLKRDGYTVDQFESNTAEPRQEKAFLLVVERGGE